MSRTLLGALLTVLLLTLAPAGHAAPQADLWPRWQTHDPDSRARIDHTAWSDWLAKYRREPGDDGVARLDYAAAKANGREALGAYIDRLAGVAISDYNRDQQFAYWVNLYNAVTVDVVLAHYPVDSIRDIDISPQWFSSGPWGKELVTVEGQALTLNDIEHRILRPIWDDPRVHYAVNCASIGCPNLQPEAFTASNTERLLERGATAYINNWRGAVIDDGELVVSSIYEWFQADFGGSEAGVIEHLRQYAEGELAERLQERSSYDDDRYDWSLNDVR
jgi:hypothetical protein